tara:strand:- start:43596 stop:44090 length:495 start_codon:yes stop_codon:yes gene_type:complete
MFEEVILENSSDPIAKIFKSACRASEKPDIGVDIKKKAAYFVIRDCATLTKKYIATHIWGTYTDPVVELKGKFTSNEVKDFLKRAKTNTESKLLKKIIVADIKDKYVVHLLSSDETTTIFDEVDENDIYSYYEEYQDDQEGGDEEEGESNSPPTDDDLILKYLF